MVLLRNYFGISFVGVCTFYMTKFDEYSYMTAHSDKKTCMTCMGNSKSY